jgi:signal transduction histidine kinase/CheY-like chemotaxis protein
VLPIRALQTGAARIGAGALDHRIDVHTGDEIEALARDFNQMAAHLANSYASLEQKVTERTKELAETAAELKVKSEELEAASQHKSDFLANMSHELRTPLNAIIGFSQVLLEGMAGEITQEQRECANDILAAGRHLLSLINDILDLSKIEAGHMDLEVRAFSLPRAIDDGVTMIKSRADVHGIRVSTSLDPGVGAVEGDERKLKQVLFNLLSNAVKFTPAGGRIDVTARSTPDEVQVAVRDSGIGIAPEDQEKIFEEFQQLNVKEYASQEGTGLGLALARRFVELHGGRIWVESQVGAGSTFTFSLPRTAALVASVQDFGRSPLPSPEDARNTVLVIEDDAAAVNLLRRYLDGAGYEVVVATDGEAGLELARRFRPFAITLDVLLPDFDGWDFLAQAKADPSIAHIPVVIVSMVDERGKGFALGAADYLVKPVAGEELLAALRRLAPSGQTGTQPTVLAIDDDPIALNLIEMVLAPAGYHVLKAGGGKEGIELAERELPSLIILDLLMPEVDGFAVAERLQASESTRAIPIFVLTSRSMTVEDKERLRGRITYLAAKGQFDTNAFVALVRSLCPASVV